MRTYLILAALAAVASPLSAQQLAQSAPPEVRSDGTTIIRLQASRALQPIQLDGKLSEGAWETAPVGSDFVQQTPNPGDPATERTEVRVVYGEDAIYVGMRMLDSNADSIASQLGRRDASGIYADWAHVAIDSYHDRRTAFRFSVTPSGIKKDALQFDDTNEDLGWDAVWDVATSRDSAGWTAEFRIPLSQLRFSTDEDGAQTWGINFMRDVARRNERSTWSPIRPQVQGFVSQFGELHGLEGLRSARSLEVLPYTVVRATRAPGDEGNPFYESTAGELSVGGDVKYGLTSNLTLNATINPDFGQVEADPSVVNLSAFESFFPERRPFFLEGSNIFRFGIGTDDGSGEALFYSRRIGRRPQRGVFEPGGHVEAPDATTIIAATKVSGRTAGGWSVGFLDAVTAAEHASVSSATGALRSEIVEPTTNYMAARVSRDFGGGNTGVGGMFTAVNRDIDEAGPLGFLRSSAYTGGANFRHRWGTGDRRYEASGWVAGSHIVGSERAISAAQLSPARYFQRPDADHVEYDPTRTSLSGAAANFWMSKIAGSWRWGAGGHTRTPGFETNDLGFMGSTDYSMVFGNASYRDFTPGKVLRQWNVGINPSASWTYGGERRHTQINMFGWWQFLNFWSVNVWTSRGFDGFSGNALRGGPGIATEGAWRANFNVNSDSRKRVTGHFGSWLSKSDQGAENVAEVWAGATFRPSGRIDLSVSPFFNRFHDEWGYVGQRQGGGGPYIFSDLDQKTFGMTTRLSYTFTPTLSLQFYAQPFVSAGEYEEFKQVTNPRADRFVDRFHTFGATEIATNRRDDGSIRGYSADTDGDGELDFDFGNPDFNFKQLRSNAVLRWEYRPGSTLFLVWSQGRTDFENDGRFGFGRDFGSLLRGSRDGVDIPSTNVFLVKFSYWLDF